MDYDVPQRKIKMPTRSNKCKIATLLPTGVICIIFALLLLNVDLIQIVADYRCLITNRSETVELMQQEFPGLHVSVYLFNVTNAREFLSGEDHKLKLQEVGPFTYLEFRSNLNMEVDEEAQVLRYSPRMRTVFLPEKSIGDPKEINVTMPNVAMLAMSSMLSSHGFLAQTAFSLLLTSLGSKAIVDLTAEEVMWGYDDPLVRLGNTVLPGWINFKSLGFMDRFYDPEVDYRLEVSTALHEKFKVKTMNGVGGLKQWGYEDPAKRSKCNTFTDAFEGLAYPQQLPPRTPIRLYRNVLCRILELEYQGRILTELGANALQYKVSNTTYGINNDTECLCGAGICMDGISDMSTCYYGLPLACSNAHFLHGDPKLFDRLEGLSPSEEKHGSEILIEPRMGLVMKTRLTAQLNLVIRKVTFDREVSRFSDMVVPVCYFKLEQPKLEAYYSNNIILMHIIMPNVLLALAVLLILGGTLMVAYSIHQLVPRLAYAKGKGVILRSPSEDILPVNTVPLLGIRYLYNHKQK